MTEALTERIINEDIKQEATYWKSKYEQAIHFVEMTEALTYDQATAKRIRSFLEEEGIWDKNTQKAI